MSPGLVVGHCWGSEEEEAASTVEVEKLELVSGGKGVRRTGKRERK